MHKEELHHAHSDVRTVVEDSLVNVLKDFILSKEERACPDMVLPASSVTHLTYQLKEFPSVETPPLPLITQDMNPPLAQALSPLELDNNPTHPSTLNTTHDNNRAMVATTNTQVTGASLAASMEVNMAVSTSHMVEGMVTRGTKEVTMATKIKVTPLMVTDTDLVVPRASAPSLWKL